MPLQKCPRYCEVGKYTVPKMDHVKKVTGDSNLERQSIQEYLLNAEALDGARYSKKIVFLKYCVSFLTAQPEGTCQVCSDCYDKLRVNVVI